MHAHCVQLGTLFVHRGLGMPPHSLSVAPLCGGSLFLLPAFWNAAPAPVALLSTCHLVESCYGTTTYVHTAHKKKEERRSRRRIVFSLANSSTGRAAVGAVGRCSSVQTLGEGIPTDFPPPSTVYVTIVGHFWGFWAAARSALSFLGGGKRQQTSIMRSGG